MAEMLIQKLLKPKNFDVFIQENMKDSTFKAEWKDEIKVVDFCAAKAYQAYLAEEKAAIVGSIIDKNGEKPIHTMPTANELVGSIGRIGDKWQMDNERLDQYIYLEGRYNDRVASQSSIGFNKEEEYRKLIKFLFDPFEKAIIAPQKRVDMLYFEGLYSGTQTVSRKNNTKANVVYSYDLGVKQFKAATAKWGEATSTPISDIQDICDYAASKGKTILKIRMSKRTFRNMCKADEIAKAFTLKLSRVEVKPSAISVNDMNAYLEGILLPTIVVEKDRFVTLADGTGTNLIPDNRVVFQCADTIAVLKVADPVEVVDQLPNKVYSTYDNNLVGYWRNDEGRFIDYEMWATPVFTGKNDYFILRTDEVEKA